MAIPAELKFDVRVRDRLLADGQLADNEVQKHLEALPDLEGQVVELTIKQPALQNESDRDIVIIRTSGVRPPIAPVRSADDLDLPIPDDDDDDDDDLDLDPKKAEAKKAAEKAAEKPKPKVAVAEDVVDDDDDDDDDDDEEKVKDDADKDDDEEKPVVKEGEVDKDWEP